MKHALSFHPLSGCLAYMPARLSEVLLREVPLCPHTLPVGPLCPTGHSGWHAASRFLLGFKVQTNFRSCQSPLSTFPASERPHAPRWLRIVVVNQALLSIPHCLGSTSPWRCLGSPAQVRSTACQCPLRVLEWRPGPMPMCRLERAVALRTLLSPLRAVSGFKARTSCRYACLCAPHARPVLGKRHSTSKTFEAPRRP